MRFVLTLFLIVLFFDLSYSSSDESLSDSESNDIPKCSLDLQEGSVCIIKPEDLRPLQFGIAGIEVDCKKGRFENMTHHQLKKYLKKEQNRVNVILSSNGVYLVDGHHMSRALLDADVSKKHKKIYCNVLANLVHLDMDEFWDELLMNNRIWLYDEKGYCPLAPEHLPIQLSNMLDDPYRTLAWMVQHAGGFQKSGIDFEDFQWTNFFRQRIDLSTNSRVRLQSAHDLGHIYQYNNLTSWTWCQVRPNSRRCIPDQLRSLETILPLALKLSVSDEASYLPGYGDGIVDPPNCGNYRDLEFLNDAKEKVLGAYRPKLSIY